MAATRQWVIDEAAQKKGKKLALELLFSLRETVRPGHQNEALGAAIAFLIGRHYSSIHTAGSPEEADGWLASVFEAAGDAAAVDDVRVGFGFIRRG